MESLSDNNEIKQRLITEIEDQLKEFKDVDILLENILSGARRLVNADAVVAEVVTSAHYTYISAYLCTMQSLRHNVAISLRCR